MMTKREIAKSSTAELSGLEGKWQEVPRHLKEVLLCEYVHSVSNVHKLSFEERKHLFSYIELQLLLKNVRKVDYSGNQVRKIRDLSFDERERRFVSPLSGTSKEFQKKPGNAPSDRFWKLLALYGKS